MKQRHFMVALDMLDEGREAYTEAAFVPAVELSVDGERNLGAEIAAFVNRPVHSGREEAPRSTHTSNDVDMMDDLPHLNVVGYVEVGTRTQSHY